MSFSSINQENNQQFVSLECEPAKFKWSSLKASGYKPLPRSSVGFTVSANSRAYCFGGVMDTEEDEEDVKGQFGDELSCLDLTSNTWRLLEVEMKVKEKAEPSEVEMKKETATSTSDGIFTITVAAPTTTKSLFGLKPRSKAKPGPTARMNPGMCVCKGNLYVYGGIYEDEDKQYTYNDFYSVDLHKLEEWKTLIKNDQSAHDWIDSGDSDSGDSDDDDMSDEDSEDDDDSDDGMETD